MNDFTKNIAQALFNQDKINDLLRKEFMIRRYLQLQPALS